MQTINSPPFIDEHRLILIKDFEKLPGYIHEGIADYIKNPLPSNILVMVASKIDEKSKIFKEVKKIGITRNFPALKRQDLFLWIRNEFKKRDKIASSQIYQFLAETVESDLRILSEEIEKICLYLGEGREVNLSEIKNFVRRSITSRIFKLTDAIALGHGGEAIIILNRLIEQKEEPMRIFGFLRRHFTMILKVKFLIKEKKSIEDIASELGVIPFVAKKYQKQSKNFSSQKLKKIFNYLLQADLDLKGSSYPRNLILEKLIVKICS